MLFSGLKLSKIFAISGSMLISLFAYSLIFSWQYAAGFVLLIFCHKMGHYFAAKSIRLNVGTPMFIPFVGAWIALKEQPLKVENQHSMTICRYYSSQLVLFLSTHKRQQSLLGYIICRIFYQSFQSHTASAV